MKPSEELLERHKQMIEENKDAHGVDGAYVRLLLRLEPNEVAHWIMAEARRGTEVDDVICAFARVLSLQLASFSASSNDPQFILNTIMYLTAHNVMGMLTGETKIDVVLVNPKTGNEMEATLQGAFARKHDFT